MKLLLGKVFPTVVETSEQDALDLLLVAYYSIFFQFPSTFSVMGSLVLRSR